MATQDSSMRHNKKNPSPWSIVRSGPRHPRDPRAVPGHSLACHRRVPSRPQVARQAQPLGARNFHDFRPCRINFGMNETGVDA